MSDMCLGQKLCFDAAMDKQNLFISGPGGVGKSYVLKKIITEFEARKRSFRVTASTGIAALGIHGSTIHSLLGTNIKGTVEDAKAMLGTYQFHNAKERLDYLDTIIIDEISMLSGDYIEMLDFWLRQTRNRYTEPFGGIQIIFCGDYLQLPPVERGGATPQYRYAFQSPSWKAGNVKTVDLTRSYRQKDQEFINALNRVRFGDYNKSVRKVFRPCVGRQLSDPTYLVSTNAEAADINFSNMLKHAGKEYSCKPLVNVLIRSKYTSKKELVEQMVRESSTDNPLRLKVGVPVLLLKNKDSYVNGSRGIVEKINLYPHGEIESVLVKLDTGQTVLVEQCTWEKLNGNDNVVATMKHLPMRLGWALTIHRSQGMTLDNVEIDLAKGFACGQAYVALSRMRDLEGLALTDAIDPALVRADNVIVDFYDKQRVNNE